MNSCGVESGALVSFVEDLGRPIGLSELRCDWNVRPDQSVISRWVQDWVGMTFGAVEGYRIIPKWSKLVSTISKTVKLSYQIGLLHNKKSTPEARNLCSVN